MQLRWAIQFKEKSTHCISVKRSWMLLFHHWNRHGQRLPSCSDVKDPAWIWLVNGFWTDEQAWSDGPVTKACRQTYLNIKTLPWRCLICSWNTHHTAMSYLNKNLHLWIKTDLESAVLWLLYVSRFSKLCVYHHVTCGLSTHKNHEIRSTHAISSQ